MTLFLFYLLFLFFGGLLLRNVSAGKRLLLVLTLSLVLAVLYFGLQRFI